MNYKTLSSEQIFDATWLKVRKDAYQTPSGKVVDSFYVYELPTWVAAVPVTDDGRIVMVRQYRHALGQEIIEIPGGCVDDTDKNFEEAIERELSEETGYTFTNYDYLGAISPNPSTNTNLLHMYLARGGRQTTSQKLDKNEEIEVLLLTIDEVKHLLRTNKIMQAMHVTCLLYALEKLGELKY